MKGLLKYFLLGFFATISYLIFLTYLNPSFKKSVLSGNTEATPTSAPTNTPTPTTLPTPSPSPIPSPTPKPTPKLIPTPVPYTPGPSEIDNLISRFSGQYGVDANLLKSIAECESEYNPLAVNKNYAGLYQFNPATWISNRASMGEDTNLDLRLSAEESIQTAAFVLSTRGGRVWPNCIP